MARFKAIIDTGNGPGVSRLGHARRGISTRVNGWESGVSVEAVVKRENDTDIFHITATGGSQGRNGSVYLGYVEEDKESQKIRFIPASS